jgi:hypothetical protein
MAHRCAWVRHAGPGPQPSESNPRKPAVACTASRSAISSLYCNTRGTGGAESSPLLVPVMTTTDAVVPARNFTVPGTFSRRTITGMRCASRIHSKVGLTEGNNWKPVLPFCWAIPKPRAVVTLISYPDIPLQGRVDSIELRLALILDVGGGNDEAVVVGKLFRLGAGAGAAGMASGPTIARSAAVAARETSARHRAIAIRNVRFGADSSRLLRANSGHSWTAWRPGEIDPKATFPLGARYGRNAPKQADRDWHLC